MFSSNKKEEWKVIEDFPRYEISSYGRVKSRIGIEKILKPFDTSKGYFCVRLSLKTNQKGKYSTRDFKVHRLVAKYFCDNYTDDCEVHHINHNRSDNKSDNLICLSKKAHAELHKKEREKLQKEEE